MKERYRKIPDISPDLYSFKGTFTYTVEALLFNLLASFCEI